MLTSASRHCFTVIFAALALAACDGDKGTNISAAESFDLTTPEIEVAAGTEKYVCYTKTLEEEVAVNRFDFEGSSTVHHVFLSRSLKKEPEGLSECNVIFKQTWLPMFVTGAGSTSLEYPEGAATVLHKGEQIVFQLHLLNASTKDVKKSATVKMRISTETDPDPVAIYAFGTQKIMLPPNKASDVNVDCSPNEDIEAFATLAHMHKIATGLHFSVEGADGKMEEVVTRDPYSFNNQFIEDKPITVKKGQKTHLTCSYNNESDHVVEFGESSNDEMCYLVGYIRGKEGAFGCMDADITAPATACTPAENDVGIGSPCTKAGGECKEGLSCTADQGQAPDQTDGFCIKIGGCTTTADCGGGDATCCAPAEGGGAINICIPEACRPSNCEVKP
jgi:hypothetical protein